MTKAFPQAAKRIIHDTTCRRSQAIMQTRRRTESWAFY